MTEPDTGGRLEEAIRAHANAQAGEATMLTDWLVIAAALTEDMECTTYVHARSQSSWHAMRGLLLRAEMELDHFDENDE